MRTPYTTAWWIGLALCLTGCATTGPAPQHYRNFFVPPPPAATQTKSIEPPDFPTSRLTSAYYANEVPSLSSTLPSVPRPSDADFLIKRSDDSFAAGKRAFQAGDLDVARHEFDKALEVLLTAPDNLIDRARLERHADQLVEEIYRYDVDEAATNADGDTEVTYDQSPIDDILNLTFPVDPRLRDKVQEQLHATSSQLPLAENDAVISFINFFSSTRGKKIMTYGLERSGRYRPMIQRILSEEGVPQELIYLAQAESGFSPRAISRARCVGVWQFFKETGNLYGLKQTSATDDRMDPERSTRAAAKHLHDLYDHFGDWYLAMAAYNCGSLCVDKAVQRTGYADFWELRRLNVLPKETANYVPAILAMTIIAKNAKDYGLDDVRFEAPIEYDSIELTSPTHMMLIAEALDRPLSEIRELNPSVLRSVAPAGHTIRVPKGTVPLVDAALNAVPASRRDSWRVHRLEGGETLRELARRFNTTQASIVAANRYEVPDSGEWVAIPVAYPGDRAPVRTRKPLAKPVPAHRTPAHTTPAHATPVHTAAKPAAAHTAAARTAPHSGANSRSTTALHPAPAAHTSLAKSAMAQPHKSLGMKPGTKSISKVQTHPAPRS
jgi:membrane-bound lytic murein transglycosylase D